MTTARMTFVKVEGVFKAKTSLAILVAVDDNELWIPRSNLGIRSDMSVDDWKRGDEVTISVAEWFAQKERLI